MVDNLARIGEILGAIGSAGCFTRRTATADDLQLEVQGLGRFRLPVSRAQAENLCRLARSARYGRGRRRFSTGESGTPGRFPGAG